MSEKMVALLVTGLLVAGLLVWGITMHFCCGYAQRKRIQREADARGMSTMR